MNLRQKVAVIITDVLLIVEICISMYLSTRQAPENLTPIFIKSFALMCVPTLIIAKITIKRLRSPEDSSSPAETDVVLPQENSPLPF
jgi:hypothetical protein